MIKYPLRHGIFLVISSALDLDHSVMTEEQGSTNEHCT